MCFSGVDGCVSGRFPTHAPQCVPPCDSSGLCDVARTDRLYAEYVMSHVGVDIILSRCILFSHHLHTLCVCVCVCVCVRAYLQAVVYFFAG